MTYSVAFVQEAEDDLAAICRYIAATKSLERATHVFDRLTGVCRALDEFPERGHCPPELERVGVTDYREAHWQPYRIIYEVTKTTVLIHAIVDGRRDLQDLLAERVLR